MLFGSYGFMQRLVVRFRSPEANERIKKERGSRLTLTEYAIAGGGAGIFSSFIVCPIELVKQKLQVQGEAAKMKESKYSGPIDCVRKVWKEEGVRGVWKGQLVTV